MLLRSHHRTKDGKDHTYWSLVETVRTADGPRQKTLCYLGELNSSAQARWVKTIEVFNDEGEAQQLKLFPSHVEAPADDPQVARVLLNKVRLERTRQFGACYLGLELWKRLELDRFFEQALDRAPADVPWSRIAALLAINRLCAPGSELAAPGCRLRQPIFRSVQAVAIPAFDPSDGNHGASGRWRCSDNMPTGITWPFLFPYSLFAPPQRPMNYLYSKCPTQVYRSIRDNSGGEMPSASISCALFSQLLRCC